MATKFARWLLLYFIGFMMLSCISYAGFFDKNAVFVDLTKDMPEDVKAFMDRKTMCTYWSSEIPGGPGVRNDEVNQHMTEDGCDEMDSIQQSLLEKYRDQQNIAAFLRQSDETAEKILGWQ